MSFDVDRNEISEAVSKADVDWIWSALRDAYCTRNEISDKLIRIRAVVDEQAEDEGLWGVSLEGTQPITEVYLQQALRRLHAVIEEG